MKKIFNLIDGHFAHDKYSVAARDSEHILWDRTLTDLNLPIFYSHMRMFDIEKFNTKKEKSFGLIFESQGVEPICYREVEKIIHKFNKVFTHSSYLLNKYENCKWIPGGGIWIEGRDDLPHGEGEIKIHKKSKLCSMVSSNKTMCPLHIFRLQIMKALKNNEKIDKFFAYGGKKEEGWIPIYQTLKEYKFSIVIENFVDDLYFTEKILNCFATGTIPIYLGAKKISSIFNSDGIFQFYSIEQLSNIINKISLEEYNSRSNAIQENYKKSLEFKSIEDYIYLNYLV